jgi:hypothetical protein
LTYIRASKIPVPPSRCQAARTRLHAGISRCSSALFNLGLSNRILAYLLGIMSSPMQLSKCSPVTWGAFALLGNRQAILAGKTACRSPEESHLIFALTLCQGFLIGRFRVD